MKLWRLAPVLFVLAACTSSAPAKPAPVSTPPPPTDAGGGCGATKIQRGGTLPAWTASAMSAFTGDPGPYVTSTEGNVVGILFGYPFHAGTPTNPTSKILWIMREPRHGAALTVEAHPLSAASPVTHAEFPADSSPGEIYPSTVDVPTAGCWHLTLAWNGNTATVDLPYGPPK